MYKYRGLNISVDQNSKKQEKTIFVRIGVLEAEFKIGSNEKCSGGLSTEEEKLVKKWMSSGDTATKLQNVFTAKKITQIASINISHPITKLFLKYLLSHYQIGSRYKPLP